MQYKKPNLIVYRLAQFLSWVLAWAVFRRRVLRNEIRDAKGPFVVIANHQCKLDFVNLIGLCPRPMTFVISKSFYSTLPIGPLLDKMGVIPKQQFQTTVKDMKRMKAVINNGAPLVLYPAGLMCEDGLSTPIPRATYKFLKWLDADVYVARTSGAYFAMPKWSARIRPGRTNMDVYKLFTREELASLSEEDIRRKTDEALLFDAYREQEQLRECYDDDVQGLENVLYVCPHCRKEFTIGVRNRNTLVCGHCGYEQVSDRMGFLRNCGTVGPEIRYVSDWSRLTYGQVQQELREEPMLQLCAGVQIQMVDPKRHKFCPVGRGELTLCDGEFRFRGEIQGEPTELTLPVSHIPILPFAPGQYLEIQNGDTIYRCVPDEGRLVMKFINMVKCFYEMRTCSA